MFTIRRMPASVALLDASPISDQEAAGSTPDGRQHYFVAIDYEYFLRSFSPFR